MIPASRPGRNAYAKIPALTFSNFIATTYAGASATVNIGPAFAGRTIVFAATDVGSYSAKSATVNGNFCPQSQYGYFYTFFDADGSLGTSCTFSLANSSSPQLALDWVMTFSNLPPGCVAYPAVVGDNYGSFSGKTYTQTFGAGGSSFTDIAYPAMVVQTASFKNGSTYYTDSVTLGADFKMINPSFTARDNTTSFLACAPITRTKPKVTYTATTTNSSVTAGNYRYCVLAKPNPSTNWYQPLYSGGSGYVIAPYAGTFNASIWGGGATGIASAGTAWVSGSGGAYAKSSFSVAAGDKIYFSVAGSAAGVASTTGVAGADSWVNKNTNAAPTSATTGALAKGAAASSLSGVGAPGSAAASIGNVTYSGGAGRTVAADAAVGGGSGANSTSNGVAGTTAAGATSGNDGGTGGAGASSTLVKGGNASAPGGGGGNSRSATLAGGAGGSGGVNATISFQ